MLICIVSRTKCLLNQKSLFDIIDQKVPNRHVTPLPVDDADCYTYYTKRMRAHSNVLHRISA